MWRGFAWLWSWRPVSVRRYEREKAARNLAEAKDELDARGAVVASAAESGLKTLGELKKTVAELSEAVAKKGAAQPEAADAPIEYPPPAPRWRIIPPSRRTDDNQDDGKFLLENLISGSVARNVRLDNDDVGQFDFEDGAFWPDLSGVQAVTFAGSFAHVDRDGDLKIRLSYYDHLGRVSHKYFWLNVDGTVKAIPDGNETVWV